MIRLRYGYTTIANYTLFWPVGLRHYTASILARYLLSTQNLCIIRLLCFICATAWHPYPFAVDSRKWVALLLMAGQVQPIRIYTENPCGRSVTPQLLTSIQNRTRQSGCDVVQTTLYVACLRHGACVSCWPEEKQLRQIAKVYIESKLQLLGAHNRTTGIFRNSYQSDKTCRLLS